MKNLLYKEFKLSVHPLMYLMIALLGMSALSPAFPSFVPLLYLGATYTILFIGMNKTTTTNDLFYTCTLPISREDVVKARVMTVTIVQLIEIAVVFLFFSVTTFVFVPGGAENYVISLNMHQGIVLFAVYLISFSVYDLIYLPWFYKNGKSIILNMFTGMLATAFVAAALTIAPYWTIRDVLTVKGGNLLIQFVILGVAIAIWVAVKFLIVKLSTKNLKKLDF